MADIFTEATRASLLLAGVEFNAGTLVTVASGSFAATVADGRPTSITDGVKLLGGLLCKINADLIGTAGTDSCDVAIFGYDPNCGLTSKWQLVKDGLISGVVAGEGMTDKFYVSGYDRIAVVPVNVSGGSAFEWSVQTSKVS